MTNFNIIGFVAALILVLIILFTVDMNRTGIQNSADNIQNAENEPR
jgi:hypothetical protein